MLYYVLLLENNKYYIGKTSRNIDERFAEHLSNPSNDWTYTYQPIKIIEEITKEDNPFEEDNITKKYMIKYGIDNVRGGSYTKFILDEWQIKALEQEFKTSNDTCYKCGKYGHFANDCNDFHLDIKRQYYDNLSLNELNDKLSELIEFRPFLINRISLIKRLKFSYDYFGDTNQNGEVKSYNINLKNIQKYYLEFKKFEKDPNILINLKHNCHNRTHPSIKSNFRYDTIAASFAIDVCDKAKLSLQCKPKIIESLYKIYIERITYEKECNQKIIAILGEQTKLEYDENLVDIDDRIEILYEMIAIKMTNDNTV